MLQAAFDMARKPVRGECVITINRQHVVFQFTNAQSAAHVLHQSRGTGADEMRTNLAQLLEVWRTFLNRRRTCS